MKTYITENELRQLEELLMKLQIPYNVSFDAHMNPDKTSVTYDKYIRLEPVVCCYKRLYDYEESAEKQLTFR